MQALPRTVRLTIEANNNDKPYIQAMLPGNANNTTVPDGDPVADDTPTPTNSTMLPAKARPPTIESKQATQGSKVVLIWSKYSTYVSYQ